MVPFSAIFRTLRRETLGPVTGLAAAGALLAAVAAGGYVWDRVRGRRTEPRREPPGATARYYRDGGDPTFGLDQSSPFG